LILSAVDWDELCPWIQIRKCLQLAFSKRLLFIVTIHLLTVSIWLAAAFGWFSGKKVLEDFLRDGSLISAYVPRPAAFCVNRPSEGISPDEAAGLKEDSPLALLVDESAERPVLISKPEPASAHSASQSSIAVCANRGFSVLYAVLSTLLLWMTIARLTALKISREYRSSIRSEMKFALSKIPSVIGAVFIILAGLFLLSLPLLLGRGFLFWDWFHSAAVWAGLTPLALIYATFFFLILSGCVLGIFFIPSVLVTENSDAFDAISRSYAYSLQSLLRFAFYVLAAILFGVPGFLLMVFCVVSILWLYLFFSGVGIFGSPVIQLCLYGFSWAVSAFLFIYFFSAAQAIYLLLRRDVDSVELDAVWLPEPQGVPIPKLPKLE